MGFISFCKNFTFLLIFFSAISATAQQSVYDTWKTNYEKGLALVELDSFKQAIHYLEKSHKIAIEVFTMEDEEYGSTILTLARTYRETGKESEALALNLELLEVFKVQKLDKEVKYAKVLREIGIIYRIKGDYDKSLETLLSAKDIIAEKLGTRDKDYGDILTFLASVYLRKGNTVEALKASQAAISIIKENQGIDNSNYANALTGLAQIYRKIGQYTKAIESQSEALLIYEQLGGKGVTYAAALFTLALLKSHKSNYEESIVLHKEVLDILARTIGKSHSYYSTVLGNLSLTYESIGDYENALKYSIEAVKTTNKNHPGYATRAQDLAYTYASLGEYDLSLEYYNKALKSIESTLGKDHDKYGKLINNIGKLYLQIGNIDIALNYFKDAIDNLKSTLTENHPDYGYYLNDYAATLLAMDQNEEAISLMQHNIALAKKNNRENTEAYFKRQYNLAKAYNKLENYNEALPLLQSATNNIERMLGKDHIDFGQIQKSLSDTYVGLGDMDKAMPLIKSSNDILINQIDQIFKFRSEKEKQAFLKMLAKNFDDLQSLTLNRNANFSTLISTNLNNQLMLKGLLLNNSKNILSQLSKLNDIAVQEKLIEYKKSRMALAQVLTQPISEREINIDSLRNIVNNKEANLVKLYSSTFDDGVSLVKDWKRSKMALNENEFAVEFSHFNLIKRGKQTDSIMYVAYVYGRESENPKMIPLFEEHQLRSLLTQNRTPNTLYKSAELYDLIWKPLTDHIDEKETVYYSPSGLLNQISFSAIPDKTDVLINSYNLIQLSSTNVLANKHSQQDVSSSVFIGGINYEYSADPVNEGVMADSDSYSYLKSTSLTNSRGTKSRGESWTYLNATLTEVENLSSKFEIRGDSVITLSKNEATEENFKKLSGNSPNILHIATHGFFYENLNRNVQFETNLSTEDQYRLAEDPLLRSGLIMAGANYAWKNSSNPPNEIEDGILTAMEISNLDLSNTDLVVLSACETGLGDIEGSEGVYGLQRAFKMAGVDKLIMSLWQVPDEETADFMQLFYEKWLNERTVRDAFIDTQREMYLKYKNEPLKWAAFVLLE